MERNERNFFIEETDDGVFGLNGLNPDILYKTYGDNANSKKMVSAVQKSLFQDLDNLDSDENYDRHLDYVKKLYFRDISKYPVLDHDEIQDLFVKYQELGKDSPEGMKIRDKIIYSNLRLAYKIAKNVYNGFKDSYKVNNLSLNDIVQAGNMGLINAVDFYSIKEGIKFTSYARHCIVRAIYYYLRYNSAFFGSEYFKFIRPIRLFVDKFFSENGREPTDAEVEQYISEYNENGRESKDEEEEQYILDYYEGSRNYMYLEAWYYYKFYLTYGLISLEQPVDDNKNLELEEATYRGSRAFLIDDKESLHEDDNYELILKDALQSSENNIDREMNANDFKILADELLDRLTDKEREVLELFYGLNDTYPHTLDEIGEKLNLSRERVRQIRERGLKRIRNDLGILGRIIIKTDFLRG